MRFGRLSPKHSGTGPQRATSQGLAHIDLVILDWFHLPFEPKEHLTDRCFDDQALRALQESPLPAVYLILEDLGRDGDPEG
jgi:hypothetical protein